MLIHPPHKASLCDVALTLATAFILMFRLCPSNMEAPVHAIEINS